MAGGLNLYGYGNGDPVNNSDPFGLCVEMHRSGNDLTLRATPVFEGLWTPADMTAVMDGIRSAWGGRRGGFNVIVDFSGGPEVKIRRTGVGNTHLGSSHGVMLGSPQGGDIEFLAMTGSAGLSASAGHEFGHVIGLIDSPFRGHLMNKNLADAGPRVTRTQMKDMLAKCSVPASNAGPASPPHPLATGEELARARSLQRVINHKSPD